MHRQALRAAALSALAACAAGCASTPAATPSATPATPTAAKGTAIFPVRQQLAAAQAPAQPAAPLSLPPPTSIPEQMRQAQTLRAQGKLQDAARILAQLVLAAPDNAQVVGEYGKTLVQMGRSDDAVAFLKRAIEIKGDEWTFYSALGVAYDQRDDRKNAKAAYDRALALHPGDATVLNNYAVSRMLAGDLDSAQRLLTQAQAAGGNNVKIAGNLQLLAQMKAKRAAAAPPSATAATGAPKTIAAAPANSPAAGAAAEPKTVVMQQVPADSHAPSARAAKPVHKLASSKAPKGNITANEPPIRSASTKPAAKAPVKSAAAKSAAAKSAAVKSAPALRTADQGE